LSATDQAYISDLRYAVDRRRATKRQTEAQDELRIKLEADYRLWLTRLLPKHFRNPILDEQFAAHHRQFFDWGWDWTPEKKPACLWVVNRGGNKSTSTAGLAVGLGARRKRKYGLVITRTETQGDTHVRRVNSMLLSSSVGEVYPGMARPQVKEVGNRKVSSAWNRTQLTTDDGWTLQSFSLLASLRGVGLEEYRPDFIWITDIDDEHDSIGMVETLLSALSSSVLATMASDCMVIFDQNLIHRGSALNQIYTRQTDVLSERETVGPIPALYDTNELSYKREQERWRIVSGRPSWPGGMPLAECESKLNLWGMDTWQREAQHNVNLAYPDAVYPMWNEAYHVITWSEFAAGFIRAGCPSEWFVDRNNRACLPSRGKIVQAQDWGNNPKHPCANRWTWTPAEEMRLNKFVFMYREMCWPRFPEVEGDDRRHPSALQVGEEILNVERAWNEGARVQWRLASHERPEIVQAYRVDMPKAGLKALIFAQINTGQARDGILHMQNFLFIEPDKPHPFRLYPEGHPNAGEPLQGCPKVFFIVADGQGELYWDQATGSLMVTPAIDEAGMARTRFEYPNYRKPDTAEGTERKDAPKRDDDIVDCDRAIAGLLFPSIEKMTFDMRVEEEMPSAVRREAIAQLTDPEARSVAEMGRYQNYHEAKARVERKQQANSGLSIYEKSRLYK
jgi:hypothetical protein